MTPLLSVAAVQDSDTTVADWAVPARPVGVLGGLVSTVQLAVAGVGSVPSAVVAATEKVWRPLPSPE